MEQLIERLRKFRDERDWGQFHNPKDLAISFSVEASELLELFQWRPENAPLDNEFKSELEGEIADVFLYLLLLCDKVGIDLEEIARRKIDVNEKRFPVPDSRGIAKP